jgi:hypothetical protein
MHWLEIGGFVTITCVNSTEFLDNTVCEVTAMPFEENTKT